jgi:hypothetical protein
MAVKAFQQKIKQAEEFALQLWLPGAHSRGPAPFEVSTGRKKNLEDEIKMII